MMIWDFFLDMIHQYDGVARSKHDREKKRWPITKWIISLAGYGYTESYTDILKNDSQMAISTFLPVMRIFETNTTAMIGEEMLDTVNKILDDTRNNYIWIHKAWQSNKEFDTQSHKVIICTKPGRIFTNQVFLPENKLTLYLENLISFGEMMVEMVVYPIHQHILHNYC